jgi:formylglycine-generating enzyme required for sulfatase activity
MPKNGISRRRFLEIAGLAASVAAVGGCNPRTPVAVTATPSPLPPTATPEPVPLTTLEPSGFEMVLVEAGSFEMGSNTGLPLEQPVHTVQITRPFYTGKYEVTFEQYDEFCDATDKTRAIDPGYGRGTRPVGNASWYDTIEFCNWLSELAGLEICYSGEGMATECDFTASGYRLPTEAEWEYAARGGTRSQGYLYAGSDDADEVAWYADNSADSTHPVGQKAPNELGLHDMSGNVYEWCWDWYDREYYAESPANDPTGPEIGEGILGRQRVRRGGDFWNDAFSVRTTARTFDIPHIRVAYEIYDYGFRVVRTA